MGKGEKGVKEVREEGEFEFHDTTQKYDNTLRI